MSLPSTNANGQPSIRNFFKPRSPSYAPPPAVIQTQAAAPPPPPPAPAPASAAAFTSPPTTGPNGLKSLPSPTSASGSQTKPTSLHPRASISAILPEHIPALRRITSLLLPIAYPDSFYAKLADPLSSGAFSRVLLWNDSSDPNAPSSSPKVIGGLVCRPEPSPFTPSSARQKPNALYIQSLVLLAPYRSLGLAAALLDEVARVAAESRFACAEVYAHVWTDNEDGLRWYLARRFVKHGQVNGYYFKLRPDSAYIVRRPIILGSVTAALGSDYNPDSMLDTTNGTTATIPPSATAAVANLITQTQAPTPPVLAATAPSPSASTSTGVLSPSLTSPPPPRSSSGPSPNRSPGLGLSYQTARPGTEWNDLPADMHASAPGSSASSRSSSAAPRKKRDRAYPAAAFGK
ncbi:hypothetical protein M426DRAFT_324633 [Hypoxylon sp. CI-4A]|nr:hypothetical protein M426DRAFT_324633 [Hypoxylon sp. CI-4A]